MILLGPFSMLLDASSQGYRQVKATVENPESLTRDLGSGRVEPPEDVPKEATSGTVVRALLMNYS
jgi:hypothetical protein